MSDFVAILLMFAPLVFLTVGFLSAWSAVQIAGWRTAMSGPVGWFSSRPGLDPAVWRHWRRMWICIVGSLACSALQNVLLFIRQ